MLVCFRLLVVCQGLDSKAATLSRADHEQHWTGRVGVAQDVAGLLCCLFHCVIHRCFVQKWCFSWPMAAKVALLQVCLRFACVVLMVVCFAGQNFVVDGGMTKKMIYVE